MILRINSDYFCKQQKPINLCNDRRCVSFEVGTKCLNSIYMSFVFKGDKLALCCTIYSSPTSKYRPTFVYLNTPTIISAMKHTVFARA
jgi:hypothetical protein